MIVSMKHITILCVANESQLALRRLRELGSIHLNLATTDSEAYRHAQGQLASAQHALRILNNVLNDKPLLTTIIGTHNVHSHDHEIPVVALLKTTLPSIISEPDAKINAIFRHAELHQALISEVDRLERECAVYLPFGEFDVALSTRLMSCGIAVQLFCAPISTTFASEPGILIQTFGRDYNFTYGVMIGSGKLPDECKKIGFPAVSISVLQAYRDQALQRATEITATLKQAAADIRPIQREIERLTDICNFATATDTMQTHGAVTWITGWIPAGQAECVRVAAVQHMWGVLLREPVAEDRPPTLLQPPRLFRPMLALFKALGISPAYHEADISVPFFCFFSIFFALLVGDGGYGAILFALTLWARKRRFPNASRAPFALLYFFAGATIVWGALSNTWFGTHPVIADNMVSLWLNDPAKGINNTMLVCFTIGVLHLSVARIWNAITLFPDTKCLAQIGWVGIIWFMYCVTCQIIGIFSAPQFIYPVFGIALALVFLFSLKKAELRENGIELGMLPLVIVSCLGDVISYVRLFAVGLASVKVAENFNAMAINLDLPWWLKAIPLLLILLIGHSLNFAMSGLSILVHAVRLNTLEFSTHKGITWAGFAFKPFRRSVPST